MKTSKKEWVIAWTALVVGLLFAVLYLTLPKESDEKQLTIDWWNCPIIGQSFATINDDQQDVRDIRLCEDGSVRFTE